MTSLRSLSFYGICLYLTFLLAGPLAFSQEESYEWWNNKHNWDGVTNWAKYLIYSPAYMGPNALPVPRIRDARIDTEVSLEGRAEMHFSGGDNTQNVFMKLHYPFLDGRVALEFYGVPVEHFKTDTLTRDERRSRDPDATGFAAGDLYIGTLVQLLRDHRRWPDLLLGISLRTASGGNLGNARFTDAPGYFFDLSMGKSFELQGNLNIRPYLMAGFYVWQTNRDDYRQNDAFLYGLGLSLTGNNMSFNTALGGYKGYIGNGDAPMVFRAHATRKFGNTHLKISFQQGLQDFRYSTAGLGVVVVIGRR